MREYKGLSFGVRNVCRPYYNGELVGEKSGLDLCSLAHRELMVMDAQGVVVEEFIEGVDEETAKELRYIVLYSTKAEVARVADEEEEAARRGRGGRGRVRRGREGKGRAHRGQGDGRRVRHGRGVGAESGLRRPSNPMYVCKAYCAIRMLATYLQSFLKRTRSAENEWCIHTCVSINNPVKKSTGSAAAKMMPASSKMVGVWQWGGGGRCRRRPCLRPVRGSKTHRRRYHSGPVSTYPAFGVVGAGTY